MSSAFSVSVGFPDICVVALISDFDRFSDLRELDFLLNRLAAGVSDCSFEVAFDLSDLFLDEAVFVTGDSSPASSDCVLYYLLVDRSHILESNNIYPDVAMASSLHFLRGFEADELRDILFSCFSRLLCRVAARLSSSIPLPPTLGSLVDALRFRAWGADFSFEVVDVDVDVDETGVFLSLTLVVGSLLDNDAGMADCLAEERVTLDDMRNFF